MSDDPTRRIPPDDPGRPAGSYGDQGARSGEAVRETVYEDDGGGGGWFAAIEDRLASIRNALILVGVLATVALALATWSLLSGDDGGGDERGASPARVEGLEERMDRLEERLENRATSGDVSELAEAQSQLADRVDALESAVEDGGGGEDQAAAIQELSDTVASLEQQIADLEARVEDIEEQQAQDGTTEP